MAGGRLLARRRFPSGRLLGGVRVYGRARTRTAWIYLGLDEWGPRGRRVRGAFISVQVRLAQSVGALHRHPNLPLIARASLVCAERLG
jgi:hypothetical protein